MREAEKNNIINDAWSFDFCGGDTYKGFCHKERNPDFHIT